MKNKYEVVRAIRELKSKDICHEYYDVIDSDVKTVLTRYGIASDWNEDESKILKEHLLRMAYQEEVREVVRITEQQCDPILAWIPNRPAPSLRLLQLEHSIWKKEMAKKRNSLENLIDSQVLCEVEK